MMEQSNRKSQCLKALGVEIFIERDKKVVEELSTTDDNEKITPAVDTASCPKMTNDWPSLEQQVKTCALCKLSKTRIQTVFGVGDKNADLLFVGEAPGANEDKQGEPFVGRGGKLLTSMIESIDLTREQVYIANVLKCRPPNNRDPVVAEVKLCTPYLKQQIAHIKPKLIVAVGRVAAHFLLGTDESMAKLRGHTYSYDYGDGEAPLLVIYHPAYLLRSPREKRKAYGDMLMIQRKLKEIY